MRYLLLLSLSLFTFGCGSLSYQVSRPNNDGCAYVTEVNTKLGKETKLLWCCKDVCKEPWLAEKSSEEPVKARSKLKK